MFKRLIPFVHDSIASCLSNDDVAVDMTAGNGHDTLFLAKLCNHVYAFDIQEKAIKKTHKRLTKENIHHVKLINDSHTNLKQHVMHPIKVCVFNLGYLPGEDASITTQKETTLEALKLALDLLVNGGLISITLYTGHPEGAFEAHLIESWVNQLPSKSYTVLKYQFINRYKAPYNLLIYKHE
ncbi:class I SAM-dependent methyltransferase [Liberiplasma polymorphum]|jgi:methylase of polypeptide subunit release factors|uniref:class I SAM-dependent methyltransferase n=1 Tax=Liberiplasma polymorphum TaxID=3374570 RepID=UPI003774DC9A